MNNVPGTLWGEGVCNKKHDFCRSTNRLTCVRLEYLAQPASEAPLSRQRIGCVMTSRRWRWRHSQAGLRLTTPWCSQSATEHMSLAMLTSRVPRCKLVRNPHISEQTLETRGESFDGRGQCHIARYEQFIFVLLHHHRHHHHHHHHNQKCNSLTNKDSF